VDEEFDTLTVHEWEIIGSGTPQQLNQPSMGQRLEILSGTTLEPDRVKGPLVKVTRTSSFPADWLDGSSGTGIGRGSGDRRSRRRSGRHHGGHRV
jgi:hypothetical protein